MRNIPGWLRPPIVDCRLASISIGPRATPWGPPAQPADVELLSGCAQPQDEDNEVINGIMPRLKQVTPRPIHVLKLDLRRDMQGETTTGAKLNSSRPPRRGNPDHDEEQLDETDADGIPYALLPKVPHDAVFQCEDVAEDVIKDICRVINIVKGGVPIIADLGAAIRTMIGSKGSIDI